MKLSKMFADASDLEITQLISDSREKTESGLYFAIKGLTNDGHDFIAQAIDNGAKAIVHSKPIDKPVEGIEYIQVEDTMTTLHETTNIFFDNPSAKLKIHSITGTNGKSTTIKTVYNILRRFGVNAGYVGTISAEYGDVILPPHFSTPDIIYLQNLYHTMVESGVTEVCQEVSSQGLALRRVDAIDFYDASWTNLSHDHLDYHHTMDQYFKHKKMLFDRLNPEGNRFINIDDAYGRKLLEDNPKHVFTLGIENEADYRATDIQLFPMHTEFNLHHDGKVYPVYSNFVAHFNVYNAINIIAILHQEGYPIEKIIPELRDINQVEGRVHKIDEGQDFLVYVDYAHSPDSVEKNLEFLRSVISKDNKVICILGAGGGRDALKRPILGKLGTTLADYTIFTEHDNRNENFEDIAREMVSGVVNDNYEVLEHRETAIAKLISMAKPGDAVAILGKGDEKYKYHGASKKPYMGDEVCASRILKGEITYEFE